MAYESEDIRKRQKRRKLDKKRQRKQAMRRRRTLIIGLAAAAVVLALTGLLILLLTSGGSPEPTEPSSENSLPIQTQPTEPETTITIAFGGDLNITDKVVASGATDGGYDYSKVFLDILPALAGADATVVNLEGNLCGAPYGTQNTSAPQELMEALAAAGVDLVQMANSCAINNGLLGLKQTLSGIRQAGMEPVGAYTSPEEFEQSRGFTLRSINGVKVAFVAFTKGMDGLALPAGSEDCVNVLYNDYTSEYSSLNKEKIQKVLRAAQLEKPDVTIALLHWGSAYNGIVSDSQKQIAELMQAEGVDAIIGTHSHYVQTVEYDSQNSTFVAYSLGDLLGDADKNNTNASTILKLEFTKDNNTGTTRISGYEHTPVYIATAEKDGVEQLRLLRIREAMAAYEANSIHKISDETYAAMKSALDRIQSRIEPEA
ncbi:MAG: CapA family protein [Oscillospiraceae bacterium]|nr:CapA family protein [Oscillospiraceae bacterium]